MKKERRLTDWNCSVCSAEKTVETEPGYYSRPDGWITIDFGPGGNDELHLCPACSRSLLAFPAFSQRHRDRVANGGKVRSRQ